MLALLVALLPATTKAARTDVVVLENGDRITGEIKTLRRGRVEFKTDKAGTILIEWDIVAELTSDLFFEVLDKRGTRLFGALLAPDRAGVLTVGSLDASTSLGRTVRTDYR